MQNIIHGKFVLAFVREALWVTFRPIFDSTKRINQLLIATDAKSGCGISAHAHKTERPLNRLCRVFLLEINFTRDVYRTLVTMNFVPLCLCEICQ